MSIDQSNPQYIKTDLKRGVDYIGVTCVFYCHDGNGRILMHRRTDNCRDEQGRWDCGGGSVEFGESWEDTVRREIKEEYGLDAFNIRHVQTTNVRRNNNGQDTHWVALIHLAQVDPDQEIVCESKKIDQAGWFHPDEFPEPRHSMFDQHFESIRPHL